MKIYHIPAAPPLYTNTFLLVGENGLAAAVDPRDVFFRDVGVHGDVNEAIALIRLNSLSLFGGDGLVQQLDIHLIAHSLHVAVLALPQQVARAADLQIAHGDAEAGTESWNRRCRTAASSL